MSGHKFHSFCLGIVLTAGALLSAEPVKTVSINDTVQLKKACESIGTPVVIVNVWAVNCSHCMDELTLLAKLASVNFKEGKDVGFLGVCLVDDSIKDFDARFTAIMNKKKSPYSTLQWAGGIEAIQKELQLSGTPYVGLLNRSGRLLEVLELPRGEADAENVIREALKRATNAAK